MAFAEAAWKTCAGGRQTALWLHVAAIMLTVVLLAVPRPLAAAELDRCVACGERLSAAAEAPQDDAVGRGVCRKCFLGMNHRWATISRFRYASFADGTMVDLKHLRASMLLSQVGGVAVANLAGWAVEWTQYGQGHVGGRPLGGNEDLYSNLAGSLFGRLASLGGVSGDWANATSGMLERLHGPLTMVRDAK